MGFQTAAESWSQEAGFGTLSGLTQPLIRPRAQASMSKSTIPLADGGVLTIPSSNA
jgi:hypothetical protein